jgi:hypothetical protein
MSTDGVMALEHKLFSRKQQQPTNFLLSLNKDYAVYNLIIKARQQTFFLGFMLMIYSTVAKI